MVVREWDIKIEIVEALFVGCVGEGQDHWKHEIKRSQIGIQRDEC